MNNYYDAFICYNSKDKEFVANINDILSINDIKTWIDHRDIPVGEPWYPFVFNNINKFDTIIIFIGQNGIGRIQEQEVESVLRAFESEKKPIIPVLIPGYSESLHELPPYIRNQLIDKHNYVDYEGDKEIATKRLIAGIRRKLPKQIILKPETDFSKVPDHQALLSYAPIFRIVWVILHVLGYLCVTAFSSMEILKEYYEFGIIVVTIVILVLLLFFGNKLLRFYKITIDKTGVIVSFFFGLFISFILVVGTEKLNSIASLSGAATTLGTGLLAGAAGGWLIGVMMSLVAGIGAYIAAVLLPWLTNNLDGLSTSSLVPIQLVLFIGTAFWALILANSLIWILKNNTRLKNLFIPKG
jgi:hypothetical protein